MPCMAMVNKLDYKIDGDLIHLILGKVVSALVILGRYQKLKLKQFV